MAFKKLARHVAFEEISRLEAIESDTFCSSSPTICIPENVGILGPMSFASSNLMSITFGGNGWLKAFKTNAFSPSALQKILVPRHIVSLPSSGFRTRQDLTEMEFADMGSLGHH
jgi:hypothetical protein